jgi:hypothetical protein
MVRSMLSRRLSDRQLLIADSSAIARSTCRFSLSSESAAAALMWLVVLVLSRDQILKRLQHQIAAFRMRHDSPLSYH